MKITRKRLWAWTTVVALVLFLVLVSTLSMSALWHLFVTWAFLAGAAFVVTYWIIAPWWRSAIGWNLQLMAAALTVAFGAFTYQAWVHQNVPRAVWVVIAFLIAVTLTQRWVLLILEHRRPAKEPNR